MVSILREMIHDYNTSKVTLQQWLGRRNWNDKRWQTVAPWQEQLWIFDTPSGALDCFQLFEALWRSKCPDVLAVQYLFSHHSQGASAISLAITDGDSVAFSG